jgi:hypothetical protein
VRSRSQARTASAVSVVGGQRRALLRLDVRGERLAVFLVRDPEDGAVLYPRHADQHRLDLGRIDVDAAGDHHVAHAVAQEEIAIPVDVSDVAARDQ